MKIMTVVGARPQFIKASVVSTALASAPAASEIVVHTGQHFDDDMSDVFFRELGMQAPVHHLAIGGGSPGEMTGRMLMALERVMQMERPDAVLVYGDTNSTLAGALAAVKLRIPIAHVEAGLRSFNLAMPEEVNRIMTDCVSRWLFTPTVLACTNLGNEGISTGRISLVGDVMYDVALLHGSRVAQQGQAFEELGLTPRGYVLATIHRAENTDDLRRLSVIIAALKRVREHIPVVLPLHPRTRKVVEKSHELGAILKLLTVTSPVGYFDMMQLEKHAAVIATDSGGVQKEAFFHRVPCVTLRNETEWAELLDAGWNRLAPPESALVVEAAILDSIGRRGQEVSPFGDGHAAARIVDRLMRDLT